MERSTVETYERMAAEYGERRRAYHPDRAESFAASLPAGGVRLDLGSGPGHYLPHLGRPVVAADAAVAMLVEARRRHPGTPAVACDLESLPFRRGSLAGVWASKCHQHIPAGRLPMALTALHRALRLGGLLDLTVFDRVGLPAHTEPISDVAHLRETSTGGPAGLDRPKPTGPGRHQPSGSGRDDPTTPGPHPPGGLDKDAANRQTGPTTASQRRGMTGADADADTPNRGTGPATGPGRCETTGADDEFPGRLFTYWDPESLHDLLIGAGFDVDELAADAPGESGVRRVFARATRARTLPDTVGPGMRLLVCGLNPSIYAADAGVGFARPGNRFWPAALAAGLVSADRDPDAALRDHGVGMTDLVKRATVAASELRPDEYRSGFARVERLVRWLRPRAICFVGLAGWRVAVDRHAVPGVQPRDVTGVPVYVMPSTSGLNAHSRLADLADHLHAAAQLPG